VAPRQHVVGCDPAMVRIDIHSVSNATGMAEWSLGHGRNRVRVASEWPEFHHRNRPDAVIVAIRAICVRRRRAGARAVGALGLDRSKDRNPPRQGQGIRCEYSALVDILPHVLPILRAIFRRRAEFVGLTISKGGAETDLRMKVAGLPCSVRLARDADARRRMIEVACSSRQLRHHQRPVMR
jgi:hypothetical protein